MTHEETLPVAFRDRLPAGIDGKYYAIQ